jgi:4-amino-4-deoxy-L-arabinose transferase-like glycosyltransferase
MKLKIDSEIFVKNKLSIFIFFALGILILFRITSFNYSYNHPDEIIAIKVAKNIIQNNKLDTNWLYADLPYYFKYPQYNFSSYNLLSAGLLKLKYNILSLEKQSDLNFLRITSGVLGLAVIILAGYLGKKLFNKLTGTYALLLIGINPLLYQDSLYARPEAFVTLIVLLYIYILWICNLSAQFRTLISSIILGVLVATKIHCSTNTVNVHKFNMKYKLHIKSNSELVRYCRSLVMS